MVLFVRLLAVFLFVASPPICGQDLLEKAREMQARVIGIDSHNDTLQRILIEHADIGKHLPDGQVDLPRLREGGIHAPFFALWAPTYYKDSEAVRRTLELRDAMQTVFDKYPDQIELAISASDVERIVKQKKIAVVLTRSAADVWPPGNPLDDSDALPQHRLGRFIDRQSRTQWSDRVRERGGA